MPMKTAGFTTSRSKSVGMTFYPASWEPTASFPTATRGGLVRSPKETIQEHRALTEAISRRDPVRAEELARLHLRKSRERLKEDMENEKERG